ncbi:ADP-ribosylglycohydrolase [Nocardia transvalensis]|uniref:ADP-ribosylglycohydrolase n=1 Tax=Nocardia transvalensis TaxID=37333 RepID=A0A7W9PI23_9NOCA|nr:ADP-ribosylglycohydrolase family protein [Nocardia transvalensis]MBB5916467.1 ADP-ribosylglycohydrolase [Nocardia transvalensis]
MLDSLEGLSVGDALGQVFPVGRRSISDLRAGAIPDGPWGWTDDTEMACSVVAELRGRGRIDQDRLATAFARRFDPGRDYGFAATHLDDYPAAITTCLAADGDIDTTSAIAGGIVAAYTGSRSATGVPQSWLAANRSPAGSTPPADRHDAASAASADGYPAPADPLQRRPPPRQVQVLRAARRTERAQRGAALGFEGRDAGGR